MSIPRTEFSQCSENLQMIVARSETVYIPPDLTHELSESEKPTTGNRDDLVMARYRDGYLHARTINGLGAAVKIVAVLIGGLLALAGFLFLDASSSGVGSFGSFGGIGAIVAMLAGLLIGGIGFILGVLLQSVGQSMKAHFDCAVNGSHFLNDEQRAEVMSLG